MSTPTSTEPLLTKSQQTSSGSTCGSKLVQRLSDVYFKVLMKCRYIIIVLWVVGLAVSIVWAPKLLSATKLDFKAPKGTLGYTAYQKYNELFPEFAGMTVILVYMTKIDAGPGTIICNYTQNFTYSLYDRVYAFENPNYPRDYQSYYTFYDMGLGIIGDGLVSTDQHSTIISIVTPSEQTSEGNDFIDWILSFLDEYPKDVNITIQRTGQNVLMADFLEQAEKEIIISDCISISIALVVLLLMLRSIVLIILPLVNLAITMSLSFAVVYAIAKQIDVAGYVPAIMMALIVAMSIDYSLFLLRRYREEILNSEDSPEMRNLAVKVMLDTAGKVVFISGTTLTLTFLGILLLGLEILTSLSLAAAVCLTFAISINLNLTPALLLAFPKFFSINGLLPCKESCRARPKMLSPEEKAAEQQRSIWFKLSILLTTPKSAIPILVISIVFLIPFIALSTQFSYTTDGTLVFSDSLPSMKTVHDMEEDFPPGMLYPFHIFPEQKENSSANINTPEFFSLSQQLISDILNVSTSYRVLPTGIQGIAFLSGIPIDYVTSQYLLDPSTTGEYADAYKYIFGTLINDYNTPTSSLINVMVSFNPNGPETDRWISDIRDILEGPKYNGNTSHPYEWYFDNVLVAQYDAASAVFENFPIMVGVTCAVVILLAALAFQSVFLPIRMVFTLGLTVGWVYGFATLVYGYILDKGLHWFPPLIVFSVIVGLGVDYDVFLFSRVTEFRKMGFTVTASIRNGYYFTGSVITGAGFIMAVAFSGLLVSRQTALQQLGFFLCLAVLLDTFIIRGLIVPVLLYFSRKFNWWPSPMAPETKDEWGNIWTPAGNSLELDSTQKTP
ncbi:MMPL family transporter [Pelomyxa schiedti]|nr:MMPL family transporter [Pelomyxa schiedti]